jgi:hypothetical protein
MCTTDTNQVATTCNAGYGLVADACGACDAFTYAVQGNSAECQTCATSGKGANAATVTCTDGTDQVATACNDGYGLVESACAALMTQVQIDDACAAYVTKCSLSDQLGACSQAELAEIAGHYRTHTLLQC